MNASDLNPDMLARLEAKLLADLEMVRKVCALFKEHGIGPSSAGAAPAPVPTLGGVSAPTLAPSTAPTPSPEALLPGVGTPTTPRKSTEQWLMEVLAAMKPEGFLTQDFKDLFHKLARYSPDDGTVKLFLVRQVRNGRVVVVERRTGRNGSLYRYVPPTPPPGSAPESISAPGAEPTATEGGSADFWEDSSAVFGASDAFYGLPRAV